MVDDHDASAELLDIGEIVRRQQHRHRSLVDKAPQTFAHRMFGDDVEPDRRLVQEQDARIVQQRGDQFALHPLAQAQLAHRHVELLTEIEQLDELAEVVSMPIVVGAVDVVEQIEALDQRQVPPQLAPLPEHDPDAPSERDASAHRHKPGDLDVAGRRRQDAGEHLDRRRLPGAVRSEVADHLPRLDRDADTGDGVDDALRASQPAGLGPDDERLAELFGDDDGRRHRVQLPVDR